VNVGVRPRWDASDKPRNATERDGLDAIVQFLGWLVTGAVTPLGDEPPRRLPWRPFRRD
jgi:hypothetical protein